MLFLSRMSVWLLAAASLAAMASGYSLLPKTDALDAAKAAANPPPGFGSATPGSAEFSSNKELKNSVKVHLAYALWHEQQGNQV